MLLLRHPWLKPRQWLAHSVLAKYSLGLPRWSGLLPVRMRIIKTCVFFSWGLSTSRRFASSSISEEPTSPSSPRENPWQKPQAAKAVKSINFADIIQDEKTQHDTFQKVTNKPLALIQVGFLFWNSSFLAWDEWPRLIL